MVSAAQKLMQTLGEIRPLIAEMRYLESERMSNKMEEIHGLVLERKWWNNAQGWTDLVGGVARGAIGIGAPFLSENIENVLKGISEAFGHFTATAKAYEQGQTFVPQHKESLFVQGYSIEKDKQRSYGELEKEMNQKVQQLQQLQQEAMRNAGAATR